MGISGHIWIFVKTVERYSNGGIRSLLFINPKMKVGIAREIREIVSERT